MALLGRGSVLFHILRDRPTPLIFRATVQFSTRPPPPNLRGCQFPHLVTMFGLLVLFEPSPQAFVLAFET